MRKQLITLLSAALLAVGMTAATPTTASAQNVWVFNQMDTGLKPCFRVGKNPWVDFGGIGAHGQFAWGDFLWIAINILGADPAATEVLVRLTWVESGPGVTCPVLNEEPNGKTVFNVDGSTPVYVHVGGAEEIRKMMPGTKNE